MIGKILVVVLMIAFMASSQTASLTQFTADVVVTNDPKTSFGTVVNTKLFYDSVNKFMRIDYPDIKISGTNQVGFKEIFDFNNAVMLQVCRNCTSFINSIKMPIYVRGPADIRTDAVENKTSFNNDQGQTCNAWRKVPAPEDGVAFLWLTEAGVPCKAERTDGTILTFSNVRSGVDISQFTSEIANCPKAPKCKTPVDLVIVLDESGSINRTEWSQMIGFAKSVVESFIIGINETQIGLVFFSGVDYMRGENPARCCGFSDPALPLSFDNETIIKFLVNHNQTGGHTCINCGIVSATQYEPNPNRPRDFQAPKIMLVITDGFNNRMTDFFKSDIAQAKREGWSMFAVGVKDSSKVELLEIASNKEQLFQIDNFAALKVIADTVQERLCGAVPNVTQCGPICKGVCGCGQCNCPSQCNASNTNDLCIKGECFEDQGGSQCVFRNKFCDQSATNGNLCLINSCDPKTGNCSVKDKDCPKNSPDKCFKPQCDPTKGCVYVDNCPAKQNVTGTINPTQCFNRSCTPDGTCSQVAVTCPPPNQCQVGVCDNAVGCVYTLINCDDNNRCTSDTCDPKIGCQNKAITCPNDDIKNNPPAKCLNFYCDPKVGCVSTNKTCDDGNLCTTDSCDQNTGACINTNIICLQNTTDLCADIVCDHKVGCIRRAKNCNDNKNCTTDTCDPAIGCVNTPITCPQDPNTSLCVNNQCEESAGRCVASPKVICEQPTDLCKRNACQPATGTCQITDVTCSNPDLCSTAVCDPVRGCQKVPRVCDDNNQCTFDSCDLKTGLCAYVQINNCTNSTTDCQGCNTTDVCNPKKCENGTCVSTPVTCPSSLCGPVTPTAVNGQCVCVTSTTVSCPATVGPCGENTCDPATGQCTALGKRVCDDGDPCTNDICTVVQGKAQCNFTAFACPGDSACSRQKCVNNNGVPQCVLDTQTSINCTTGSECGVGFCNNRTGQCEVTFTSCPNPSNTTCARAVCNPLTAKCEQTTGLTCTPNDPIGCGINGRCVLIGGKETCQYDAKCPANDNPCNIVTCVNLSNNTNANCQTTTVDCNDNDTCTTDQCVPDGVDIFGKPKTRCVNTPMTCPPSTDPCKLNVCQSVNGRPTCVEKGVTCNTTNKCLVGACFQGFCNFTEINCGRSNVCATFMCDPARGCITQLKCDDKNNCTDDFCDAVTGNCTFVPKSCNSTSICKRGICDSSKGCIEVPLNCGTNVTAKITPCTFPICNNSTGCGLGIVPGSLNPACGTCGPCANRKSAIPAAAIAGAIIGAAIIAGIFAVAIGLCAASGSATGFAAGTEGAIVGGNTNPLYCEDLVSGTNPLDPNTDYVPL